MENPREDVKEVILGLLDRPTLRGQAAIRNKFSLLDVEFFYLYFNTKGVGEMTVIYQVAQILANYEQISNYLRFTLRSIVSEAVMVGFKLLEFVLPSELEKTIFG